MVWVAMLIPDRRSPSPEDDAVAAARAAAIAVPAARWSGRGVPPRADCADAPGRAPPSAEAPAPRAAARAVPARAAAPDAEPAEARAPPPSRRRGDLSVVSAFGPERGHERWDAGERCAEITEVYGPETLFGRYALAEVARVSPAYVVPLVSGAPSTAPAAWDDMVFLDTETTGLSAQRGAFAFLIGIGFLSADGTARVVQLMARRRDEERATLERLRELIDGRRWIVTYNGDGFDIPLLRTRFATNALLDPFDALAPFDLLKPARRLYRDRTTNRRLKTLEAEVLGLYREGDVDGAAIPGVYNEFVRARGRHPQMEAVLGHNRLDVLALPVLMADMARLAVYVRGGPEASPDAAERARMHPAELTALGTLLTARKRWDEAEGLFRAALDRFPFRGDAVLAAPTLSHHDRALAADAHRGLRDVYDHLGDAPRAYAHAHALTVLMPFDPDAKKRAAVIAERRLHDPARALEHVTAALTLLRADDARRAEFVQRAERLQSALPGRPNPQTRGDAT